MNCPICNGDRTRFLFESYDDRFGYPDSFPLHQCNECKHIFLVGDFTPELLSDLYTKYYPRANFDVDAFVPYSEKKGFLAWLDGERGRCHTWVPNDVRVLDIGCGFCETLGYHKNRGCEVYGVEVDENISELAERHGFNIHIGLFDPNNYEENFFDYVTMDNVVEHLIDPIETMRGVARVLKPGGRFVLNFPAPFSAGRYLFGRRWAGWHTPYHLQFFSSKSLNKAADQSGFEVETYKSLTWSILLFVQWINLVFHGKKGEAHPIHKSGVSFGHTDSEMSKSWIVRFGKFLQMIRIHAWIVRFDDAIGMGEFRLCVLKKK